MQVIAAPKHIAQDDAVIVKGAGNANIQRGAPRYSSYKMRILGINIKPADPADASLVTKPSEDSNPCFVENNWRGSQRGVLVPSISS